jgi:type IV pilus assembly protein PilW
MLKQRGVTLIEMMIALVLSLLVMGMVISMFTSSIGGHAQAIRTMRLNQDLRISMDMMVRDIRRAGYWNSTNLPASNPHATAISGNIPVGVFDGVGTDDCVVMSYDLDEQGELAVEEFFAYRQNGGDLETLKSDGLSAGTVCPASGWNDLTDEETVVIDRLEFITHPATAASFAASSNRTITITLEGHSALDDNIRTVLVDEVRVRNEL